MLNGCQNYFTGTLWTNFRRTDMTTRHLTRLSNDDSQVIGYSPNGSCRTNFLNVHSQYF